MEGVIEIKIYKTNEHIASQVLRVVAANGEQLGVISKGEALEKARSQGLDLIEVAPQANPPVARIVDFKKFRYEEKKKEKAARKGDNSSGLKELWLSPRIANHDLGVRLSRVGEFLAEGHKVKLTVKFKGREMAYPQFGQQVLQKALELLGDKVTIEREAKMEGRKMSMILGKAKANPKIEEKKEQENETQKQVI